MLTHFKNFNHLNLIFDQISDMVFLIKVDKDGIFRYANANSAALKNSNLPNNYKGKRLDEILPHESAITITEQYQKAIDTKELVTYEAEMYMPEDAHSEKSNVKYFESRVTPIFNDNWECEHLVAITHDITDRKRIEKEKQQEKTRLELIFNYAADAVFTFDNNGDFTDVNPGFTKLLGWTKEELIENPTHSIVPKDNKEDINYIIERLKNGEILQNHLSERVKKDGSVINVISSYTPIMEDGDFTGGVAMYKDITELQRMATQLRDSEHRYRQIADHLTDLIRVVDTKGIITYASPSHKELLGVEPDFFMNKSVLTFAHADDMSDIQTFLDSIINTKTPNTVEFRRLHKDGESIWMESKGTPVLETNGNVEKVILVTREIAEQKEREEAYKHQANHDELTNLPNRRMFDEQLSRIMEDSRRMKWTTAVFTLDCDNFKEVNDNYGHDVGDKVIKIFGARIKEKIGENCIVSRIGGDEFQVVLPAIERKDDAIWIAQSILESIREPFVIDDYKLYLTTSIGISFYDRKEKEKDILIKEADNALYHAKESGRDTFHIFAEQRKPSFWMRMREKWLTI